MTGETTPPPPTGGGYPVLAVGARLVNPHDRKALSNATLTLSTDAEAEAKGFRVVELVREACVERDLGRVSLLHMMFGDLVRRVPEFHIFFDQIMSRRDRTEIDKLLGVPRTGRGRRPGDVFEFVALIEYVMKRKELDHATDAVDWLIEHRRDLDLPDDHLPVAKTLLNQHARFGEYFRLWSSSIYVKPELLTLMPPSFPGVEYTPEMIEGARFPPTDGSEWPSGLLIEVRPPFDRHANVPGKKGSK